MENKLQSIISSIIVGFAAALNLFNTVLNIPFVGWVLKIFGTMLIVFLTFITNEMAKEVWAAFLKPRVVNLFKSNKGDKQKDKTG